MTLYDQSVITLYADRLYTKATWIVVGYTLIGFALGVPLGIVAGATASSTFQLGEAPLLAVFGALAFGALVTAIGNIVGETRAFSLKLQAQTALCQVRIELNTRYYAARPDPLHPASVSPRTAM